MPKYLFLGLVSTLVFGGALGFFFGYDQGFERAEEAGISSFEECAAAGYPIMESYPEQCATRDGKHFTREIEEVPDEPDDAPIDGGNENPKPIQIPEPVACTMDAKICPDGSGVGRVGPNCEFAPCPGE